MKQSAALLLSVLWTLALLTGCSNTGGHFEEKNYTSNGESVSGVHMDVRDREIKVSLSTDNQIHIDYWESEKEYYDISRSEDGILTMTLKNNKDWTDYIGTGTPAGANQISLQVPDRLLSTLVLNTTKEDISLSTLSVTDRISLSTNSGNIRFERLDVGNTLTLENKNGDISGAIGGSYEDYSISCSFKKGNSNLPANKNDGVKVLNVTNNNGDIDLHFVGD